MRIMVAEWLLFYPNKFCLVLKKKVLNCVGGF